MNQEMKEQFQKKVQHCYAAQKAEWLKQPQEELIENAFRIDAAKRIAEILPESVNEIEMSYLMRFKDPLKIVTDAWVIEKEYPIDFDEQLSWVVWELTDKCDADGFYERENNGISAV